MPLKPIETTRGPLEYEVTGSFAWHFSRYLLLPNITESDEFRSGQTFHLLPIIKRFTNEYLTQEEQQATYLRRNGKPESVFAAIRWYVPFDGRERMVIERVRPGWYQRPTGEAVIDRSGDEIDREVAEEAGLETEGWIYAFTFPELIKNEPFPIKIGMTIRDVDERIKDQCKGSAIFSSPTLLRSWPVNQVTLTERAVHNLLKLSGKWKTDAPGTEWFMTTIEDIERIIGVVRNETR